MTQAKAVFPKTLNAKKFALTSGTKVCNADEETLFGNYQVDYNTTVHYGQGNDQNGTDTREEVVIKLYDDAGVQIMDAEIELIVVDPQKLGTLPVHQGLASEWSAGKKISVTNPNAVERGWLKFRITCDADTTIDFTKAGTLIKVPTIHTLY